VIFVTELHFKGKEFVYNHHLTVPHRPLVPHPDKGVGAARLDGNLIIQGDNLHALKALLPTHAGKVDCIFIDPPYNTGNEGWCYNDNVNSPMIKEWLAGNPIGIEDGLRHDKWCAMMWPRLRLLWELLSEEGSLWVTLDENEVHHATAILDGIFGADNRLGVLVWEKSDSPRMDANTFSSSHDFLLAYAKDPDKILFKRLATDPDDTPDHYNQIDEHSRRFYLKPLRAMGSGDDTRAARPSLYFGLTAPDGTVVFPMRPDGFEGRWRWGEEKVQRELSRIEWRGGSGSWSPYFRIYADTSDGRPPETIWYHRDVGSSRTAKAQIKQIFGEAAFDTPKPLDLVKRVLEIATTDASIILDSFAGSGTTAHAVLEANRRDGGNRRFILVEMEDYADRLTAERVRRVIKGYPFKGTQKTELHRESLTWAKLQKADRFTETVEKIETLHGHEYTKITKRIDGGDFIVTGERMVEERAAGLGGEFTYCTLGDPIDMDRILTGGQLPPFADLGTVLFHTATSQTCDPAQMNAETGYLGEAAGQKLWLIYRADLEWLKSPAAALTLSFAQQISADDPVSRHIVFAPANHTSPNLLRHHRIGNVEFAPLPYALYRVERG
jgi:adenine-specific DNA-methyltransferase